MLEKPETAEVWLTRAHRNQERIHPFSLFLQRPLLTNINIVRDGKGETCRGHVKKCEIGLRFYPTLKLTN